MTAVAASLAFVALDAPEAPVTKVLSVALPPPPRPTVAVHDDGSLSDEDIEYHLNNWARWHRASNFGALRQLWYPGKASGKMGVSGSTTFDDMCEGVDAETARAMNAVIDDLPVVKRALLHHLYLQAVYRFPRLASLEDEYAVTLTLLRGGMLRKGVFA